MATSARQAALQEIRKATAALRGFAGARKVLSPYGSLAGEVSTIARRALSAEIEAKERLYKDGQLSNEEMRVYYQGLRANPLLTPLEKVGIEDNLRDFDDRVRLSALESAYTSSPDNSLARVQAAQALTNYYQTKASGMVPGTPAHSSATQEAGRWGNVVTTETNQIQKLARANRRAQLEAEAAAMPHNTPERAMAKAQAYKQLSDMAAADGEMTEAQRYLNQANEQQVYAQEISTRQTVAGEKEDIGNILGQLANDYNDGRINEEQYLNALADISPRIDATNDYGLIDTLNRTVNTVTKNQERGGLRRGTAAGGRLPTVLGRGGAGGAKTYWAVQDFQYSDNLRTIWEDLKNPKFTQEALEDLATVTKERARQLDERVATVYAIASENPNAKITGADGRKHRAQDVYNDLLKEQKSIEEQVDAMYSENAALMEIPPTPGAELGTGKSRVNYKLVNPTIFKPGTVVIDEAGIIHKLSRKRIYLENLSEEDFLAAQAGYYTDPKTGEILKISKNTDNSGKEYFDLPKQTYRSYKAGTTEYKEFPYEEGKWAKTYEGAIQEEAEKAWEEEAKFKEKKAEVKEKVVKGELISPLPEDYPEGYKGLIKQPTLMEKIITPRVEKIKEIAAPIVEKAQEVIAPVKPVVEKIMTAPLPGAPAFKPEEQLKITEPIRIAQPPIQMPAEKLQIAVPPKTELQKQVEKPGGFKIELGPEYAPPVAVKPPEPWLPKVKKLATQILPTIKSWFGR